MGAMVTGLFITGALVPTTVVTATPASATTLDTLPVTSAQVQHVWLIILENKSFDETFTGLNSNSYLWQTLPSEGVLLENYYGTGHSSMDNYISLVSGQAPEEDTQEDCSDANVPMGSNSTIITSAMDISDGGTGTVGGATPNWNFGQVSSLLNASQPSGANAPLGSTAATNGCTYPSEIETLFDQFNLAGVSWKGYAQDLGGAQPEGSTTFVNNAVPNRDNGPCGAPGSATENPVSNPTFLSGAEGYPVASALVSSTATSGTTTTLTDTSQSWTANQYAGDELLITGGTGAGEHATVASNTATTLTFSAPATAPASGSTYEIGVQDTSTYTAASLVAGTGTTNDPQYSDQYVAKHFPFPWFESLIGSYNTTTGATGPALTEPASGTNCDANHIANLDSPTDGLVQDLQNNTVPAFSWITPNNCSDAHDTTCKGNNLSGAFGLNSNGTVNLNDPIYRPAGLPAFDPEATTPRNYTGGLYASDLFLAYYVPLIEDSAAYAHGLIDITFDEGEPSFTYSGNSFNNVPTTGPNGQGTTAPSGFTTSNLLGNTNTPSTNNPNYTPYSANTPTFGAAGTSAPGADSVYGAYGVTADAAGENIGGTNVNVEPWGPNSTLSTNSSGDQLYPGPGNNSFIDRPPVCTQTTPTLVPADCVHGIVRGGSGSSPGARTDGASAGVSGSASSNVITDNSIIGDDTGRAVTGTNIPAGAFVGAVTDSGPLFPATSGGATVTGSFQLVNASGVALDPSGAVSSVTLSAEGDPNDLPAGDTSDPLFDATDPTPGGGDTGSVLISPYITPGTVSTTYYNHYSWLRTMEDLFDVSSCAGTSTDVSLPAGTVCGGLDGLGHIGYAAQVGLAPFGADVFSAPSGNGWQPTAPPNALPEAPLAVALPACGIALLGGVLFMSRRRRKAVASV